MVIENETKAVDYLSNISYYRLKAYFLYFRNHHDPLKNYMPWASFNKVIYIYNFDRELRFILLNVIERIEVSLRCKISQEYCERYGTLWYEDKSLYSPSFIADTTNKGYAGWVKLYNREIKKSKETFIAHYRNNYTSPENPPSWMFTEVLSFGQLSMLYKNLRITDAKKAVAESFGVSPVILESWIEHLAYIRNMCAHHSRIWNRSMTVKPIIPTAAIKYGWVEKSKLKPDKVFTSICIMAYIANTVLSKSYFAGQIRALVHRYSKVEILSAGFFENWEQDDFWKSLYISKTYKARIVIFKVANWAIPKTG